MSVFDNIIKTELQGKIISMPINHGHVKLLDENGHDQTDESKLPLVYNEEKGIFRIVGWTSKMGGIVTVKNVVTGEVLEYAPMKELKKLYLEYFNTNIGNYQTLPIITEVDYTYLHREHKDLIDDPDKNKVRFYEMYYEVDNTEEAREQFNDGESQIESSTKAVYYAKLVYTPDEQWDNIISEATKYRTGVRPVTDHTEREKAFWNYIKSNYHPPTKRK